MANGYKIFDEYIKTNEKDLTEQWTTREVVISLNDAKRIVAAFKGMQMKEGSDCLIFNSNGFIDFRLPGKQREFYTILKKSEVA